MSLAIASLSLVLAASQDPVADGADAAQVDALVAKAMARPEAAALSVAVARGDTLVYSQAHGLAEREFGAVADEQTLFRIGSITKQFTAAAIVKLAEAGALGLDDPLVEHLGDYPATAELTLRHLLTHTGGVPSYTGLGAPWELGKARELADEELVALWKDLPLEFAPGERWNYSNSGYYLLGMVVAEVSGKAYAQYLQETFFTPLGLERTRYDSNAEVIPNRAQGYAFEGGRHLNDGLLAMSQPGAAGALLSTASDLVRWQQALVSGRLVSAESYAEMTLPYMLADGREADYGMGLQLQILAGQRCVWHGGGIDGFNSVLLYWPDAELHVAVISSSERLRADALGLELGTALLGAK
jgi:CubicO group peptidase (beta-lactamase class C family)